MQKPQLTEEELNLLLGADQGGGDWGPSHSDLQNESIGLEKIQRLTQTVTALQHQLNQLFFKVEKLEKELALYDVQSRRGDSFYNDKHPEDKEIQEEKPPQQELSRVKSHRKRKS